jgi:O-methyltransferase
MPFIVCAVVPRSVRLRLHVLVHYQDYICMPRESLQYAEDNVFTANAAPFLDDEDFLRAYDLREKTNSWHGASIRWRAYVACWAGSYAGKIDGDFVECGVNRGGLARAIIDYVGFESLNKRFYLIDTFAGIVPAYLSQSEMEIGIPSVYSYYANNSAEIVRNSFAPFAGVRIVDGVVPDILSSLPISRVAFLSLDMNCAMPEIRAAEFFWPRMCSGGVMLLDDYGNPLHCEQQKAFDCFARDRGVRVLVLPTGQGLIFKNGEM